MLDVNTVADDRQMRSLTGLDMAAFAGLIEPFAAGCQQEADARFSPSAPASAPASAALGQAARACWPAPNRSSCSSSTTCILYYLKAYPSFDVLRATFGLPRSNACEHAHHLAKARERTRRTLGVLPARAIDSLAHMPQVFADVPVLLLDATERPHRRTQAAVDRPADYSGKKKAHA